MDNLINLVKENSIDYEKIHNECVYIIKDSDEEFDINFLIPVRNRLDFAEPMYNSFINAKNKSNLKITYTIVEHSINPEHSKFCKKNNLNYIWIPCKNNDLFNKCLCFNVGVFLQKKSKSFIFHDIDCLVQSDFFIKLNENITNKQCKAIQCFKDRRVLYLNDYLTLNIINKKINIDEININTAGVHLPLQFGAPGGSLMVDRNIFFEAGGYDPEIFAGNCPEDAFFWTKVNNITKIETSDNPEIEIFHMQHRPTYHDNPYYDSMGKINSDFQTSSLEEQKKYALFKFNLIQKYQ